MRITLQSCQANPTNEIQYDKHQGGNQGTEKSGKVIVRCSIAIPTSNRELFQIKNWKQLKSTISNTKMIILDLPKSCVALHVTNRIF